MMRELWMAFILFVLAALNVKWHMSMVTFDKILYPIPHGQLLPEIWGIYFGYVLILYLFLFTGD